MLRRNGVGVFREDKQVVPSLHGLHRAAEGGHQFPGLVAEHGDAFQLIHRPHRHRADEPGDGPLEKLREPLLPGDGVAVHIGRHLVLVHGDFADGPGSDGHGNVQHAHNGAIKLSVVA